MTAQQTNEPQTVLAAGAAGFPASRAWAPDKAAVERRLAEVWIAVGECYQAMERIDEALGAYARALELDPGSTLALVGRAEAQFALEHSDLAALAEYDRALTSGRRRPLIGLA